MPKRVSIHAPAWGATHPKAKAFIDILFQSTLPRGERLETAVGAKEKLEVSIHAPAWGATVAMLTCYNLTKTNCQKAILLKKLNFKMNMTC
ncbi:MAG: hypothetical protein CSA23_01105 [Deltaproteobacteria bacterium]|nr:MAG: hypothetical protein CSA23_01105 [Deltaproteobacteria bacterium]